MSQSKWLSHPPIGVGIAVAIMLMSAAALENQKHQAECRNRSPSNNCERIFEYVGSADIAPIASIETPPRHSQPERQEWRSEQELQAQWEMARWAFWAAFAAIMTAFITGVGVIYVARTLDATRAAVDEAAKATEIADQGVAVARDSAAKQLRAYASVSVVGPIREYKSENGFMCDVVIEVRGATPAYNCSITIFTAPLHPVDCPPIVEGKTRYPVVRDDDREVKITHYETNYGTKTESQHHQFLFQGPGPITIRGVRLNEGHLENLKSKTMAIFIWGRLDYTDAFELPRHAHFCYRAQETSEGMIGIPEQCDGYNDAS